MLSIWLHDQRIFGESNQVTEANISAKFAEVKAAMNHLRHYVNTTGMYCFFSFCTMRVWSFCYILYARAAKKNILWRLFLFGANL